MQRYNQSVLCVEFLYSTRVSANIRYVINFNRTKTILGITSIDFQGRFADN